MWFPAGENRGNCKGDGRAGYHLQHRPRPGAGEEELSQIRSDAVLIEIASTPHGFDIDKAKEMGVQVVVGSSLPGTMSPMTAGKIIAQVLTSLLAER